MRQIHNTVLGINRNTMSYHTITVIEKYLREITHKIIHEFVCFVKA